MKPVLLSALVAAMLVSPALAKTSTNEAPAKPAACMSEKQVIEAAPPGAEVVRKLSAREVKNLVRHAKLGDNVDAITVYSSIDGRKVGMLTFFSFKGGCAIGVGAFKANLIDSLLSDKDVDDGSI